MTFHNVTTLCLALTTATSLGCAEAPIDGPSCAESGRCEETLPEQEEPTPDKSACGPVVDQESLSSETDIITLRFHASGRLTNQQTEFRFPDRAFQRDGMATSDYQYDGSLCRLSLDGRAILHLHSILRCPSRLAS